MVNKNRLIFISLTVLIVFAVMALAAGMNTVNFEPGHTFWVIGEQDKSINIEMGTLGLGSESLAKFIGFVGAALVFMLPVGIVIMLIDPEQRIKLLVTFFQLMLIALMGIVLNYMKQEGMIPDLTNNSPFVVGSQAGTEELDSAIAAPISVGEAPEWLVLVASGIAAVTLFYSGRYIYERYLLPTPLQQIGEDARDALRNLRSGADVNDAIRKCYYEMSDTLRREHSIRRNQAMTVREFEELLEKSGLPRTYIRDLTRLFEKVRYGAKKPTDSDELQAVECFTAIMEVAASGGSE